MTEWIGALTPIVSALIIAVLTLYVSKRLAHKDDADKSLLNLEPLERYVKDNLRKLLQIQGALTKADVRGRQSSLVSTEKEEAEFGALEKTLFRDENYLRAYNDAGGVRMIVFDEWRTAQDLAEKELRWFYENGANLGMTSYLLACLLTHMYRTKYEICSMKLRYAEWERILFHIDEVDQILDAHLAIFTVVQHDIAQLMTLPETAKVISYQTFCRLLQEGGHECLARLVMFFINVGAKGRKEQFSELVETLRRFHDDLRGLIYGARGAGRPARRAREKRRTNLP